jgi:predicted dehydrogenase
MACSNANPQGSPRLRAALIGCGRAGFGYDPDGKGTGALSHFQALVQSLDVELIAICETDRGTRERVQARLPVDAYADHSALLKNRKDIDLFVVATPDETHERILLDIADYSPRAVLAEKPLATTRSGVERVLQAYERRRIGLQVNFTRRFQQEFEAIKDRIAEGEFGELQTVTVYYTRGFLHNGSHFVDLLHWFFGDPIRVVETDSRPGLRSADPTRGMLFHYYGNLTVRLVPLMAGRLGINEIDFMGTQGRVRINSDCEIELYRVGENERYKGFTQYVLSERTAIDIAAALPAAIRNLVQWTRGNEPLRSPGYNSLLPFKLLEQIQEEHICLS